MMKLIATPDANFNHPDEVLAQTLAAQHGFQMNAAGNIFDNRGDYVADSLTEMAKAARSLGWFTPFDAVATGVYWANVPHDAGTFGYQFAAAVRRIRA